MLRGVCLESRVDKYFVLLDSDELLGLLHTKMIFSELNQRWEIVERLDERKVLAFLEARFSSNLIGRKPLSVEILP